MIKQLSRRFTLKLLALGSLVGCKDGNKSIAEELLPKNDRSWRNTHDRVWLGGDYWANPMEDWSLSDGWAECGTTAGNRSIHHLTHQITNSKAGFTMSVQIGQKDSTRKNGGAGFRIGVSSDINEYRSNCFAKNGINIGITPGHLIIGNRKQPLEEEVDWTLITLALTGEPKEDKYLLTLTASNQAGELIAAVSHSVAGESIIGNVALVSQFQGPKARVEATGFRFTDWKLDGEAFTVTESHSFGPILWSMYTLSDSRTEEDGFILKLSALTGPLGRDDNQEVELQIEHDGDWKSMGKVSLDTDAWVATFRIPNWTETSEVPYRVVYFEKHKDDTETLNEWNGKIKANPEGRPLRFGALTCQNDYAFPYEPVAENIVKLDPDMLYFSGDQLYESHGGFGIIRDPAEPAILNYLRKFYQFGWAFRDAMKNSPTVCLPDDHDVFQGNIWGEGGAPMKDLTKGASSKGGYREPARMVNAVHRTNTAHHPDPFDSKPVEQDISVYYTDLVYGNVSFAIIADRQWKSGPERVDTGEGRADHVSNPDFDTAALDQPGLILLGERQEKFLEQWGKNWKGHSMKVLLSQTVFAGVATHHGKRTGYLKADLDSGAWPQAARNRAIDIVRESMALHINGDQHLTTLSQYGVERQRDSNWSFCTPAIAAGYPRWWLPDEVGIPHQNRPKHGHANTGEFLDGFGNKVYVHAVGNPEVATQKNRYKKAHQKGSGFGLVTIDTVAKTYYIESFKFQINATDGKPENQFPGWPVTIHQSENKGENKIG